MKHLRFLLSVILIVFAAANAFADDRAATIQSRIINALGNILPRTDYLVTVNHADQLDDGGQNDVITGTLKPLPGLNVGVDSKGQIVRQDALSAQYNGPVVITIVLDKSVQEDTITTIQQMLPEISGGLRDTDEYKVRKALLRQPNAPDLNAPVNVNNIMPKDGGKDWSDTMRFFAILLLTAGTFAWLLSRVLPGKSSSGSSDRLPFQDRTNREEEVANKSQEWDFEPHVVALFLLKSLSEKRLPALVCWIQTSNAGHQRQVLRSLPAWTASYLQSLIDNKNSFEGIEAEPQTTVFREVTVFEQNLKTAADKARAFLQWFPAPGLRHVPKQFQHSFSGEGRKCLWSLRPDLGEFVAIENPDLTNLADPTEDEVLQCYQELKTWPSTLFVKSRSGNRDLVTLLATKINQINEFGPLQTQIEQAKANLAPVDFTRLQSLVVTMETPLLWDEDRRREWLRHVDPQDYFWWHSLLKEKPSWKLDQELRPMRKAMFRFAESNIAYTSWAENEKKAAALRLIQQLRHIHLGEDFHAVGQAA